MSDRPEFPPCACGEGEASMKALTDERPLCRECWMEDAGPLVDPSTFSQRVERIPSVFAQEPAPEATWRAEVIPPSPSGKGDQPMPTQGRESVTEALIADIRAREAKGIATYGASLRSWNGRDALRDALEEALDLAQYIKQAAMERADLVREVEGLRAEVATLRAQLANTEELRQEALDAAESTALVAHGF